MTAPRSRVTVSKSRGSAASLKSVATGSRQAATSPSAEPRDALVAAVAAGARRAQAARAAGVSPQRASQVAAKAGLPRGRPGRPRSSVVAPGTAAGRELLAMVADLARELGVPPQVVVLAGAWALGYGRVVIDSSGDTLDHREAIGILRRGLAAIASGGQPADVARVVSPPATIPSRRSSRNRRIR